MAKLEVKNLSISFRTNNGAVRAVRDISFSLNEGETLAIAAPSWASSPETPWWTTVRSSTTARIF